MKLLIDTDPGVDDAVALAMVLSRKDIEIVAITCVLGNSNVDNSTVNTLKILEAFDRKDIPVFKGAYSSIIKCKQNGEYYHGTAGLGNTDHIIPDRSPLKEEHAALAINRIVHEHKGEVTIVALGPLTNLALALRLNENLAKEVKELIIMGGNHQGVGNVTMAAEFNFYVDPIAAHIVLEEFTCPKLLVTWELSGQPVLVQKDVEEYVNRDNKPSKFMKTILASKMKDFSCGMCDSVAMAIAINRDVIVKKLDVYATVEINGGLCKGSVVIDWKPQYRQVGEKKNPNVTLVDQFDHDLYKKLFMEGTL